MRGFERGDIVRVNLEPVAGHEMRGDARPALVLTTSEFNRLGDVLVAPHYAGWGLCTIRGLCGHAFRDGLQNPGCGPDQQNQDDGLDGAWCQKN